LVAITNFHDKDQQLLCSLWDAASGKARSQPVTGAGTSYAYLPSPDGRWVARRMADGLFLLDATTGKPIRRMEGAAPLSTRPAFAGNGKTLTVTSKDGVLRIWSTETGKLLHQHPVASAPLRAVALSHDGTLAAVATEVDQSLHLVDTASGKELHCFPGH